MKAKLLPLLAGLMFLFTFTACVDDDDYSPFGPKGSFIDRNIEGEWELCTVNGMPVFGDKVNYLEFDDDGEGTYYYYDRGREMAEDFVFWNYIYGGNYYLHIDYDYRPESDMAYWFSNDSYYLYLQWWDGEQSVTYCYRYVDDY